MEQIMGNNRYANYYVFGVVMFLGAFSGSLITNLFLSGEVTEHIQEYNILVLLTSKIQWDFDELFFYLLWRRMLLLGGILAGMFLLPRKGMLCLLSFFLGYGFSSLISVQVMCSGIKGIYSIFLFSMPQGIFYLFSIFLILKQHKKRFPMILFAVVLWFSGILLECYVNPVILNLFVNG